MKKEFGRLASGEMASLYTISCGKITAEISDYGATLVRLYVPDRAGNMADVVLGFDDPNQYTASGTFFGAVVGRNANRVKNASFVLGGKLLHSHLAVGLFTVLPGLHLFQQLAQRFSQFLFGQL